ncbi:hypothetical protein Tco_1203452 [Tanacetum coccineum]
MKVEESLNVTFDESPPLTKLPPLVDDDVGRTIDPSFYNDLSDDLVAKFTAIGFDCLLSLNKKICPRTVHEKVDKDGNIIHKLPNQIETNELFSHLRPYELVIKENVYSAIGNRDHTQAVIALMLNLKANMAKHPFDACYKLVYRKMSPLKAKQPKRHPPKRARNVGKSKCTQLSTSSSIESPPSDNEDLLSTKLSPRSYSRALKDYPNMSKEQRETRGMFKNLG